MSKLIRIRKIYFLSLIIISFSNNALSEDIVYSEEDFDLAQEIVAQNIPA